MNEGDIFTSAYYKSSDIATHPFGEVHMKLSYSPSCLGTLCFSTFRQCAATILNCHVCDLAFVGYSNHGASSSLTGSTFTNCTFDIMGGQYYPMGANGLVLATLSKYGQIHQEIFLLKDVFSAVLSLLQSRFSVMSQDLLHKEDLDSSET